MARTGVADTVDTVQSFSVHTITPSMHNEVSVNRCQYETCR